MRAPIDGGVVLVTGASSGIGRAMARQLARRATRLILVARRRERLDTLATELRQAHIELTVDVMPTDLADPGALDALTETLLGQTWCRGPEGARGGVDILVNNAGLGQIGLFEGSDEAQLCTMLQVNITAVTLLTRRLLPPMLARKRGGVLFVSSAFGLTWMPGFSAYAATKQYVTAFADALGTELRGTGVVVSQACPGPVATEFEAVAGNPTGQEVPGFVEISAEHCADAALDAFSVGRPLHVPSLLMKVLMLAASFTPRWVFRLMYAPVGPWLRKRQAAAGR